MRKKRAIRGWLTGALLVGVTGLTVSVAEARHAKRVFRAPLGGFAEVPSISTAGHGRLWLRVSRDEGLIEYKLTYSDMTSAVTQAHIHFGESRTNGGVAVVLCQSATAPDPSGLAPMCVAEGTVEGTFTAEQVIGPEAQGIGPGQIRELIRALRHRAGYVNVHTERFPAGEIRGQIK